MTERKDCPSCKRNRPVFVFDETGACDNCRIETLRLHAPTIDKLAEIRAERQRRLEASDWTQLSDVPPETSKKWQAYRQALRDVLDEYEKTKVLTWPKKPI